MIIFYSLQWYILIELLAVLAFILTFKLFHKLPDQGFCISKVIGIILSSFISWIIMSYNLGKFEFSPAISYISAGILALLSIIMLIQFYSKEDFKNLFHFIDKRFGFILFVEAVFLIILISGAYIRAYSPDILSINKLQDLVYIKSIMSGTSLPPENIWLSGYKINYYYFGYFILANQINMSNIAINFSFNLIPATILGLIVISSGGIVYNLTNSKLYGIMGGFLTGFMANFEAIGQILLLGTRKELDWWLSAHILPGGAFTEFPFWSFLLGDLQAFYLVHILILALIYLVHTAIKENKLITLPQIALSSIAVNVLISIILATIFTTNIFAIFTALLIVFTIPLYTLKLSMTLKEKLIIYFINVFVCFLVAILIDLPFILSYKFPYTSLSIFDQSIKIPFKSFFILFGAFFIPIIIYLLIQIKNFLNLNTPKLILLGVSTFSIIEIILICNAKVNSIIISLILILSLIAIATYGFYKVIKSNNKTVKVKLGIITAIILLLIGLYLITNNLIIVFTIALCIISCFILFKECNLSKFITIGLLFICSLTILIASISCFKTYEVNDMTTISYLYMQAQLILPIILTMIVFFTIPKLNNISKRVYLTLLTMILLPCFIFMILGPYYKSNKFPLIPGLLPNLSGTNHLIYFHDTDYQAIEWIKEQLPPKSIILEANQPDKDYSGRISAYTGMSTILGWINRQEFAYGPSIKRELNNRQSDINKIYSERDKHKVLDLIKKYNIRYIYVGELENALYPDDSLSGFKEVASLIFQSSGPKSSKVYELEGNSSY